MFPTFQHPHSPSAKKVQSERHSLDPISERQGQAVENRNVPIDHAQVHERSQTRYFLFLMQLSQALQHGRFEKRLRRSPVLSIQTLNVSLCALVLVSLKLRCDNQHVANCNCMLPKQKVLAVKVERVHHLLSVVHEILPVTCNYRRTTRHFRTNARKLECSAREWLISTPCFGGHVFKLELSTTGIPVGCMPNSRTKDISKSAFITKCVNHLPLKPHGGIVEHVASCGHEDRNFGQVRMKGVYHNHASVVTALAILESSDDVCKCDFRRADWHFKIRFALMMFLWAPAFRSTTCTFTIPPAKIAERVCALVPLHFTVCVRFIFAQLVRHLAKWNIRRLHRLLQQSNNNRQDLPGSPKSTTILWNRIQPSFHCSFAHGAIEIGRNKPHCPWTVVVEDPLVHHHRARVLCVSASTRLCDIHILHGTVEDVEYRQTVRHFDGRIVIEHH